MTEETNKEPVPQTNIREYRRKRRISLVELSEMTGIGKDTINRYERGTCKTIDLIDIVRIAKALHVKPGLLIKWENVESALIMNVPKN